MKTAIPPQAQKPKVRKTPPRSPVATSPATARLFFALRVPSEVATELAAAQTKLRGNWRSVNPGQLHVTLSYMPAVEFAQLEGIKRLGTSLARQAPPLAVRLRGTGYFPNEGSPRVWFVKAEADGLSELAEGLRSGLQYLGVQTDDLPFKPHITLARKKGPAPRVPPLTFELGWDASAITLYRSILRKTGPIYEVESTFRLQGQGRAPLPEPVAPAAAPAPQE